MSHIIKSVKDIDYYIMIIVLMLMNATKELINVTWMVYVEIQQDHTPVIAKKDI